MQTSLDWISFQRVEIGSVKFKQSSQIPHDLIYLTSLDLSVRSKYVKVFKLEWTFVRGRRSFFYRVFVSRFVEKPKFEHHEYNFDDFKRQNIVNAGRRIFQIFQTFMFVL